MRKIVIDMQNYLFADVVAAAFKSSDYDIEVIRAESPRDTVELCQIYEPFVLVMEVTGYAPWKLGERLRLRDEVKAVSQLQDRADGGCQHRTADGKGHPGRQEGRADRSVFLRLHACRVPDGSDLCYVKERARNGIFHKQLQEPAESGNDGKEKMLWRTSVEFAARTST